MLLPLPTVRAPRPRPRPALATVLPPADRRAAALAEILRLHRDAMARLAAGGAK